jgi:hypothetical protein
MQQIQKLKEEKLILDLGHADPINEMKSTQLAHQIKELEDQAELTQLEVLLDNLTDRLAREIDEAREEGNHIRTDNSYRSNSTGYRLVEDVEFTDSFIQLQEALDTATKMLAIVENLINR